MRRAWILPIVGLMLATMFNAGAQEEAAGWPVEQRCVGEPTRPPEGWTFEGTIFTRDATGIRGVRGDIETPYFIIFSDWFTNSAAPSPDGRWYAVASGRVTPAYMVDNFFTIEEIRVYSTDGGRQLFRAPWNMVYRGGGSYSIGQIHWLDNEHLIYEQGRYDSIRAYYVLNPFTGEVKPFENELFVAGLASFPASDGYRTVIYAQEATDTIIEGWGLYDLPTSEFITEFPLNDATTLAGAINWLPDSSAFTGVVAHQNAAAGSSTREIVLFDRDGNIREVIYQDTQDGLYGKQSISPNGLYLIFLENHRVHVADLQSRRIMDLCLTAPHREAFWSPNSAQIALTYDGDISVIDLQIEESFTVAYDIGIVVGWGAAD